MKKLPSTFVFVCMVVFFGGFLAGCSLPQLNLLASFGSFWGFRCMLGGV